MVPVGTMGPICGLDPASLSIQGHIRRGIKKVQWSLTIKGLKYENQNLESDLLLNLKPMQLAKHRLNVYY